MIYKYVTAAILMLRDPDHQSSYASLAFERLLAPFPDSCDVLQIHHSLDSFDLARRDELASALQVFLDIVVPRYLDVEDQ